jgi:exodeoxyribonuclease I
MTHTFLWHDYETFGLDTRRDRPAQFAGIRTDADLNEIGEPIELYCLPQADYLPDPQSCLLTGITPQRCIERGIPEFEFARQIEAALGAEGTIGVGYNTIRFDDEVTRNLFWRNLIAPYDREFRNRCGRWDIQDLVRGVYALRPDGMVWPTAPNANGDGQRVSFKLELLAKANGIEHAAAHDAVSDVRATIALARLIKERQPKLFDFYLALHKKDRVMHELGLPALPMDAKPFLHVSGMFPAERGCLAVMWPLAAHPTNKNEVIAWDLSAEADSPSILRDLKADEIRQRMFSKQADLPQGELRRLPIKTIHINKSPFVVGKLLSPALQAKWGINQEQCLERARLAQALPEMSAVWTEVFARPQQGAASSPDVSDANSDSRDSLGLRDVDEALYDGFVGDADRRTLWQLQKLSASSPDKLGERQMAFDDARLDEVLWRYRARNFPHSLTTEEQAAWRKHCRARLVEGAGNARTLAQYGAAIEGLEVALDAALDGASQPTMASKAVLMRLREYGASLGDSLGGAWV